MKLLIVDDNEPTRKIIRTICASLGAEILEAGDGNAAVRVCCEQHPDCILMDIKMRPVNGLTAARTIHQCWTEVCIIIVSNCDDPETRAAAREAGASGFISKDHLFDELPKLMSLWR